MTGALVALLLGAAAWLLFRPLRAPGPLVDPWPGQRGGRGLLVRTGLAGGDSETNPVARGVSDPALLLDLVAAMLVSGRPLPHGLHILGESADPHLARILARVVTALELGSDWAAAWDLVLGGSVLKHTGATRQARATAGVLRDALAFAATSGAPSADVLHAHAEQIRRRRRREAERRAAALGIQLVLPLGLCALPAFICLTVVPLLLALLPSL